MNAERVRKCPSTKRRVRKILVAQNRKLVPPCPSNRISFCRLVSQATDCFAESLEEMQAELKAEQQAIVEAMRKLAEWWAEIARAAEEERRQEEQHREEEAR